MNKNQNIYNYQTQYFVFYSYISKSLSDLIMNLHAGLVLLCFFKNIFMREKSNLSLTEYFKI